MSSPLIGTVINDQYRLTEVLGEGGMGIVYKAEDLNLSNRLCAIKLLKGQTTDPNEAKRFEAELQIISRLRSPHVVQVLNKGYIEGYRLFIVMELLEGTPLSNLIKDEGKLQVKRAIQITKGVLAGLSEAHEYGVVHRDLKPANIFITRSRARDEITKVLDFGIAKDTNKDDTTGLTSASMLIGTPKYMAPEQFMKEDTDARTDLYAVGLLLYQMLAGEPPYVAESPLVPDTLKRMPNEFKVGWLHMNATPSPLPVPSSLWDLCCRLLEKQREDRPNSANEVITELNQILERADVTSGAYSLGGENFYEQNPSSAHARVGSTPQVLPAPPATHEAPIASAPPTPSRAHLTHTPPPHAHLNAPHVSGTGDRWGQHDPLAQTLDESHFEGHAFDLHELEELEPLDELAPARTSSLKWVIVALVALTVGGISFKMIQGKSGALGGTCFDRVLVSPPGQYQVSQASLSLKGKAGRSISLGKTNQRGALNMIISRSCSKTLRLQITRGGFKDLSFDLKHIQRGKTVSHTLNAEVAIKATPPSQPQLETPQAPVTPRQERQSSKGSQKKPKKKSKGSWRSRQKARQRTRALKKSESGKAQKAQKTQKTSRESSTSPPTSPSPRTNQVPVKRRNKLKKNEPGLVF